MQRGVKEDAGTSRMADQQVTPTKCMISTHKCCEHASRVPEGRRAHAHIHQLCPVMWTKTHCHMTRRQPAYVGMVIVCR